MELTTKPCAECGAPVRSLPTDEGNHFCTACGFKRVHKAHAMQKQNPTMTFDECLDKAFSVDA